MFLSSGFLSINLSAIQSNWQLFSSLCGAETIAGAVIKANAYGLDAGKIAQALYKAGCREFFFATKEEALEVKALLAADIRLYVLGGVRPTDEKIFIESGLIPVLFSCESLKRWAAICDELKIYAPSIIKINTGMNRLGLDLKEFESLCNNPALLAKLNPIIIMSHLACADEFDHPMNAEQLKLFNLCVGKIKPLLPHLRFSLANSSGVFLGKDWHFDLLRPGAGLYGINPAPWLPNPLKPVVNLSLPILQIRYVEGDAFVGYGASTKIAKGSKLAVVAGGYADGIHRTLGLAPEGYLYGQLVHAVGRIAMDTMVFDISDIDVPETELLGAFVEVVNNTLTLDYLMQKNNALGYDVLTSIGARYHKYYVESS